MNPEKNPEERRKTLTLDSASRAGERKKNGFDFLFSIKRAQGRKCRD